MLPLTDFSAKFNNPHRADVLLHLSTSVEVPVEVSKGSQPQPTTGDAVASSSGAQLQDRNSKGKEQQRVAAAGASTAKPQDHTPGSIVRTYHLHSLLLASHSLYFESRLGPSWPQSDSRKRRRKEARSATAAAGDATQDAGASRSSSSCSNSHNGGSSSLTEVTELVEEAELEAIHELLKLMYSQKVPSDAPAELLLKCLRLADRYQAAHCIGLLLAHLAAKGQGLPKQATDSSILTQVSTLPPAVRSHAQYPDLVRTCHKFVVATFNKSVWSAIHADLLAACRLFIVQQFQKVPAVIRNDSQREQFCALPFEAVLAWAESDQLQVHSENCVVYLLSAWVKARWEDEDEDGVSEEQLEQLAQQVRVLHLGPAYQYFILPSLKWFKDRSCVVHLPALLAYKGRTFKGTPVYPAPYRRKEDHGNSWAWKGPPAWVAGPRQRMTATQRAANASVSWELGPAELKDLEELQWISCNHLLDPNKHRYLYRNGFQLYCGLDLEKGLDDEEPDSASVSLGMYLHVSSELMEQHGVPLPSTAPLSVSGVLLAVECAGAGSNPDGSEARCMRMESPCITSEAGRGTGSILGESAPTLQELVAPLLINGKLRVKMTVADADLP